MPPIPLTVDVYGRKGNPSNTSEPANKKKAQYLNYDDGEIIAQKRFKKLRPNVVRVEGTNVGNNTNKQNFKITHDDYEFAILDIEKANNNLIYVYFVVWETGGDRKGKTPITTGDLTVSIDTVAAPAVEGSGDDGDVDYEAPSGEN